MTILNNCNYHALSAVDELEKALRLAQADDENEVTRALAVAVGAARKAYFLTSVASYLPDFLITGTAEHHEPGVIVLKLKKLETLEEYSIPVPSRGCGVDVASLVKAEVAAADKL